MPAPVGSCFAPRAIFCPVRNREQLHRAQAAKQRQQKEEQWRKPIDQLLSSYERGGVSRREFVQVLAALAAIPEALYGETSTSVFKGRNLNHVTLSVSDVQRSRDFYQHLLGLAVIKQDEKRCNLAVGDRFMGLYRHDKPGYIDHFCIGIDDFALDSVKRALVEQGLNLTIEFGTQVYFRDPEGSRVPLSR